MALCLLGNLQARTITVVGDDNYPPYLFKDASGNTVGYIADLWALWEQQTGVRVNLVATSWGDAQQQLLNGQADVIEMIFRTPEREDAYSFSQPYERVNANIYTLDGIVGISSPRELSGFVVGVQKGDACIAKLNAAGVGGLQTYDGYRQMISDTLAKKIKIFCMDEYPADYYLYLMDADKHIRKAFSFYFDDFRRAVRKNDLATLELVERGMAAIPLAEREALEKKWKGRPVHRLSYSQLVQYGLLGIAALGGVLALWIWLLRVAVKKKTTEIQAQASQLGLERSRLQEILDATRAGIWEWNVQTGACVFNERWAQMLGYTLEEIRPWTVDTWTRLTHPDDLAPTMERLELHFARKTQYYESEMRMRHKDGHWVWVSDRGRLISRTPEGLPLVMNGTHIDITESKIANDAIWQQANYDSLTQLPNRLLLNDRLTDVLKRAERSQNKVALIFIDLDHFKEVNDTLGHPVGDQLIIQAGARIRRSVRESDTVARLGGDEFCILIADLADVTHLTELAQKVLDQLACPYALGDEQVYSTASLGISIYPDDAGDAIEMLRHSDQAMYAAKNEGRHCFRFFTASMQESALQRMQLVRDLRQAMALNQFKDYYQPIVELATGRIHKAEALLRWRHPTHGFISPAVFIPIAEDIGAIVEIGGWIFLRAAQNAKKWLSIVGDDLAISINKSPVQFRDRSPEHLDWVRLLETLELPGKHIVAEITEGLLLRQEPFIEEKLLAFRDAGIQVAIDDFGTGYSSLSYLTKFDIDYLKIDKSFTSNLAPGNETQALCEAIIMMAHKVGLKVIAEGVETEQQRDLLKEMGCDYAQGYLYSRPIPAHEFQQMLEAHYRSLNSAVQE